MVIEVIDVLKDCKMRHKPDYTTISQIQSWEFMEEL